jgi:hypothetical protein
MGQGIWNLRPGYKLLGNGGTTQPVKTHVDPGEIDRDLWSCLIGAFSKRGEWKVESRAVAGIDFAFHKATSKGTPKSSYPTESISATGRVRRRRYGNMSGKLTFSRLEFEDQPVLEFLEQLLVIKQGGDIL